MLLFSLIFFQMFTRKNFRTKSSERSLSCATAQRNQQLPSSSSLATLNGMKHKLKPAEAHLDETRAQPIDLIRFKNRRFNLGSEPIGSTSYENLISDSLLFHSNKRSTTTTSHTTPNTPCLHLTNDECASFNKKRLELETII